MKQHIRLAHVDTHALHQEAVQRCHPLGLAAESPCKYCGTAHSQPRRHLQSCSAVYQASLAELYLRSPANPPPEDPDGGRRSSVAAAEAQQVFGGLRSSQAMEKAASQKEDEWEGWSNRDKAKFQRKGETAGKGGWQSWTSNKRKEPTNKTSGTEEAASLDTATQSLIQSMTRLVLRHESELSNLRREMGYMLFIDTEQYSCLETLKLAAVKWQELYAANKVTSFLGLTLMLGMVQALRTKLEEVLRDESLVQRYKNCGWISDGANAFSPMWHFFEWNPAEKKEFQSTIPPLPHTRIQQMLEEMERSLPLPGVLLKFRATKDITRAADGGSPESFRSAPAALGKRGDEAPGSSSSTGARPATASGEASGDFVQGHELLRLEPVPELEVADLGRSATVALREVQQWERPLLSMPGARLRNPHNVCYINSCVQAFFWIGALTGEARSVYGALQASTCALHAKASLYLPECMSWRTVASTQ